MKSNCLLSKYNFMKIQLFLFLFIVLSASQCDKSEINQEINCYHFDERQCSTDPFHEGVTDRNQLLDSIKLWLKSNGVDVITFSVNSEFHQAVCEACHICPVGPRYYITFPTNQSESFEELELLNWGKDECVD